MHPYQIASHEDCDQAEERGQYQAKVVELHAVPYFRFVDCDILLERCFAKFILRVNHTVLILQRGVAYVPHHVGLEISPAQPSKSKLFYYDLRHCALFCRRQREIIKSLLLLWSQERATLSPVRAVKSETKVVSV